MPNPVFAQILLYFGVICERILSSAGSSVDVCEFVSKTEPVTADMGYGQRFQAVHNKPPNPAILEC